MTTQRSSRRGAGFSPVELDAWRGFLAVHASLARELDAELQANEGMPLPNYEILMLVAESPAGRRRISDLSRATLLSLSGVSRMVDRLVAEGLLAKERCDDDRRGWFACITDQGRIHLARARRIHYDGVRRRFLGSFSDDELQQMAEFWARLGPVA